MPPAYCWCNLLQAWSWSFLVLIILYCICLPISMKASILEIASVKSWWMMWKFSPFLPNVLSCSSQYLLLMMNVEIYCSLKCFFVFTRELNDNQLIGNIPPELGKLTDLYDLYVLISLSVFSLFLFLYYIN